MAKKITSTKDIIMLLLFARGSQSQECEPIRGRTRLVKMVFLFKNEISNKFNFPKIIQSAALPDFVPYDYGPFSPQIYSDIEFLRDSGFIKTKPEADVPLQEEDAFEYAKWVDEAGPIAEVEVPAKEEEFSLTNLGKEFVEVGEAGNLTDEQWRVLSEFKIRCTLASLKSLLSYVYEKYPNMTTRSKIKDEVLS